MRRSRSRSFVSPGHSRQVSTSCRLSPHERGLLKANADVEPCRPFATKRSRSREHALASVNYRWIATWSDGSRRAYFHFVDVLARKLAADRKTLSATLRLHQIKYVERRRASSATCDADAATSAGSKRKARTARSSTPTPADNQLHQGLSPSLDVVLPAFYGAFIPVKDVPAS